MTDVEKDVLTLWSIIDVCWEYGLIPSDLSHETAQEIAEKYGWGEIWKMNSESESLTSK